MSATLSRMDCCVGLPHCMGWLPSPVGAVAFVMEGALPIPWSYYLNSYDKHVLQQLDCLCLFPVTCYQSFTSYVTGDEVWSLHCHCGRQGSLQVGPRRLQCLAAAKVRELVVQKFLLGTRFNEYYPQYRVHANRYVNPGLEYVGSVWCGKHFIYVRADGAEFARLKGLRARLGQGVLFCESLLSCYVVIVCQQCACPPTDAQVDHCMRLLSFTLRRWQNLLLGRSGSSPLIPGFDIPRNRTERLRQRMLHRFYSYRTPIYRLTYLRG
ncbi:E4 34K [Murine mastadenovirus A]|nr:E4 34K [Murine mastadenovirus A]